MAKPKKTRKLETHNKIFDKTSTVSERKSLPLLKFADLVRGTLKEQFGALPANFTHDDLANEVHVYLDHSVRTVMLRGRFPKQIQAIDIRKYFNPPHTGERFEVLDQSDFKDSAELLLTDENFLLLEEPMQQLRKYAMELGINWTIAASVIGKVADEFRPDRRPERVRRGEFCEQVLRELKAIRQRQDEFRHFEELERLFPEYGIVKILKHPPFNDSLRDQLAHPNRWDSPRNQAYAFLKTYYEVSSDETIEKYRKTYKASLKS